MIQSQYTSKKHLKRRLKIKEISILKSKDVLLFSVVTVIIISHHLNKVKARHRQAMRRKHITKRAYKKQLQHRNGGNSLASALDTPLKKCPPQEQSLLKLLNNTRKLLQA